jgi:hypothetical protein
VVAAAVVASMASCPASADIRITSDAGGALGQQLQRVEAVRQSGERVIIDGQCNSACTLRLSLAPAQLCVHWAMDSVAGMPSPKWNEAKATMATTRRWTSRNRPPRGLAHAILARVARYHNLPQSSTGLHSSKLRLKAKET